MSARVLFRVDAHPEIGNGHLMRCLALAAQVRALGGEAVFVSHIEPVRLREKVGQTGFKAVDAPKDMQALPLPADWVVLDGYRFGLLEQRAIKALGVRLMVIDDMALQEEYCADLVLNQNVVDGVRYPGAGRALLGPSFALLRPEFRDAARRAPGTRGRRNVLMTLGSGATPGVAEVLFAAMRDCPLEMHVRVLGARPQQSFSRSRLTMECLDYADDMPAQMAWADLALCAGGGTCWELACMGVPALITVLSRDQETVAGQMAGSGCGVSLGWHADLAPAAALDMLGEMLGAPEKLQQMRRNGPLLVDGLGAQRVAHALLEEKE